MLEALDGLRRADEPATAAPRSLAFLAHRFAAAFRTDMREFEGLRFPRPPRRNNADNLWDDVAGALDDDRVAFANVLALDLILVMQGGAADDDAADRDRLELGNRRQRAAPADLDADLLEQRLRLLRREFMRDRPARRPRDEAQTLFEVEIVHLIDDAVDVVGQRGAFLADAAMKRQELVDAEAELRQRIDGEAPGREMLQRLAMRLGESRALLAPSIGEESERALRRDR